MPMTAPKALKTDNSLTMREKAYEQLRQLLILSQLVRGQRLREPEWAARLGVNRAALREAFARLEAEGLLELGERTGYFVPELSDNDIAEMMKVRLIIEKAAIDELGAQKKHFKQRLAPMRDALAAFESMARDRYVLGTIEADRRFHEALVDASGVGMLARLYRRAPLPMISRAIAGKDEWNRNAAETLREHRELLHALEAGHSEKAKKILHDHIERASAALMCA